MGHTVQKVVPDVENENEEIVETESTEIALPGSRHGLGRRNGGSGVPKSRSERTHALSGNLDAPWYTRRQGPLQG
jgi:hypothetical protein